MEHGALHISYAVINFKYTPLMIFIIEDEMNKVATLFYYINVKLQFNSLLLMLEEHQMKESI